MGRFPDADRFRPAGLIVRRMKNRWGSLSPAGGLLVNRHLIEDPPDAIDYVIAHEFCHMAEPNHGSGFHRVLSRMMPGWQEWKETARGGDGVRGDHSPTGDSFSTLTSSTLGLNTGTVMPPRPARPVMLWTSSRQ